MIKHNVQYVSFYTVGSTARKITPVMKAVKAVLPKPRKQKRKAICVDPVALLSIVVAVCMLAMMVAGLSQLRAAQVQVQVMARYVDELSEKNAALSEQFSEGYDIEEIERTALALGMIPQEQAPQTSIEVTPPQPERVETASLWEHIGTLLSGLFA